LIILTFLVVLVRLHKHLKYINRPVGYAPQFIIQRQPPPAYSTQVEVQQQPQYNPFVIGQRQPEYNPAFTAPPPYNPSYSNTQPQSAFGFGLGRSENEKY
jgi:hypothetical protein